MSSKKTIKDQTRLAGPEQPMHSGIFVRNYLFLLVALSAFLAYLFWSAPKSYAHALRNEPTANTQAPVTDCGAALPMVEWLGEGGINYVLPQDFDIFIVKRLPFKFVLESGQLNANGKTVYRAKDGERVWACQGNCQLPAVYHDGYALGNFEPGTIVNIVVIDDDGLAQNNDQRRNWWAINDPLVPYAVVEEQTMVEYLSFAIPETGTWYYYANDSIGIAAQCIEAAPPATPTGTATPSPTATATASSTATATAEPTVTATATATATHTPTATATETAIETATPISATPMPRPSETPTTTLTASPTPVHTVTATSTVVAATPTPTNTATTVSTPVGAGTPPVFVTMTMTPTLIVKEPPTALHLLYFDGNTQAAAIVLRWETAFEIDFAGFQLWRSSNGQRADAQPITPTIMSRRGTAGSGAAYAFIDSNVSRGVQYTYWLREIDGNGDGIDVRITMAALTYQLYVPYIGR